MPRVTRFPGFRSRSIAYGNASRALPIGRMSQKKTPTTHVVIAALDAAIRTNKSPHAANPPSMARYSLARKNKTCLQGKIPSWLNIPWQETNPFPELVEGNIQKNVFVKQWGS